MSATTSEENRLAKKARNKAYYEANKEKILAKGKAYREANKEKIRAKGKAYREANKEHRAAYREANKEHRAAYRKANREKILARSRELYIANREKHMLSRAKGRAKRKNLPFDLEVEDIIVPDVCPVLGIKLKSNVDTGKFSYQTPSLDRIIPELGYVKGNVRVISYRANNLKSDATFEEALLLAEDARKIKGY